MKIIFWLIFFLANSNNPILFQQNYFFSEEVISMVSVEKYVNEWKYDKKGCYNLREIRKLKIIIKEYQLDSSKSEKVLSILGVPDTTYQFMATFRYCYFFNTQCYKQKIWDDTDFGSVEFIFYNKDSTLQSISFGTY